MNTRILSLITAGAMLLSSVAVSGCSQSSTVAGISDTLSIAERYLAELNYEQAIIEFDKVLNIDPNNVDAYLGKAEAYLALGNTEAAVSALRTGYDKTGDARIKSKLDELTAGEETSGTTMTEGPETAAEQETTGGTETTTEPETTAAATTAASQTVFINGSSYDVDTTTDLYMNWSSVDVGSFNYYISNIGKLKNLKTLYISDITIRDADEHGSEIDISPLSNLTELTYLVLSNCYVSDISALSGMTKLTVLDISENSITDITPLGGLTELTDLCIFDNDIVDISPLSNLTKLEHIRLGEEVQNISVLDELPNCTDRWYMGHNDDDTYGKSYWGSAF